VFWDIFYSLLMLLAGLGAFLYGLHVFSGFFKRNNHKVKNAFAKIGENRFFNAGIGAGTTVAVQSSTATTVTIVGLISAGVMTLPQATAAIIGANVGSALSDMLLSLSAFRIRYIFMAFTFVGVLGKAFTKRNNWFCKASDLFISFGLIFIGLNLMRSAFSDNIHLTEFFTNMFEVVRFPLLLVLLGFLLTAIIQSSSASVGLYIAMAANGVFGIETVLYLVIGSSLGTTLTMMLAAIPANRDAKRAALIHLFYNLFGTILFVTLIWSAGHILIPPFTRLIPSLIWQISVFSVILNLTTALILIWLVKPLTALVRKIIPDKPDKVIDMEEILV